MIEQMETRCKIIDKLRKINYKNKFLELFEKLKKDKFVFTQFI